MGRGKRGAAASIVVHPAGVTPMRAPAAEPAGLVALEVVAVDEARRSATIRIAGREIEAALDRALDAAVVATAISRRERVIAQREDGGWIVLGALRTARTPGIEPGEDYVIRAARVHVDATREFAVTSGKASFVVRAYGYVETLAQDITTRAASVHKVIGRMLRLN